MSNRSKHAPMALFTALVCASLAAGCAPEPPFAFRSQHGAATAPIQRLQVYAPIATGEPGNPVTFAMYDAFQTSLVFRLSLCRVKADVSPFAPLAAGDQEAQDAGAAHRLMIQIVDKQVVATHLLNRWGFEHATIYSGTLYFGLDLADARSHTSVWTARSSFKFPTAERDDDIAGTGFARGIVTQLQRDGLLTSCVHESYPGCLADRREEARRAERIVDDRERLKAMNRRPECK